MPKILILGQIPDEFNLDKHIPIGPSCFIGKEHIFPEFEDLEYIDSYESDEDLLLLDKLTTNEAIFLISIVAKRYNPDNFHKYSFQFWETIYFPFLALLVPFIYRWQIIIRKIIEKHADENIEVLLFTGDIKAVFQDETQAITHGLLNPIFNEWICSQIIDATKPDNWKVRYKTIENIEISAIKKRYPYLSIFKKLFDSLFFRCSGVYGFNQLDNIYFHLLLSLKPKLKKKKIRTKISENTSNINWEINIYSIIDSVLPENLKHLNISFYQTKKNISNKLANFSNRLAYVLDAKLLAAFTYENNGIVIATQHGGCHYGSTLTCEFLHVDYRSDVNITWGTYNRGGKFENNFLPLPSPLLSKFLNSHIQKNNDLILVSATLRPICTRFDSGSNPVNAIKFRKNKLSFFNNLAPTKTFYRPYPVSNKSDLLDWEYIRERTSNVEKLEGNLHKQLQNCKLLILDNPGTTWNIAMAMNTPTICFWQREHFPFNAESELNLNKFKELGLYFDDPINAAGKVNFLLSEYSDLTEWWNKKEIQDLRKDWMNEYGRADKGWRWIWTKSLWQLKLDNRENFG